MVTSMVTFIDDGVVHEVEATVEDARVLLSEAALATLGWELHPEGLCRDGLCIPVPEDAALAFGSRVDFVALARLLDRPLAVDTDERAVYLGVSAADRSRALRSLVAPDFTLPDLAGRPHRLSDHRGKKVLLVAYASW
jgi:AhpC/TSA family